MTKPSNIIYRFNYIGTCSVCYNLNNVVRTNNQIQSNIDMFICEKYKDFEPIDNIRPHYTITFFGQNVDFWYKKMEIDDYQISFDNCVSQFKLGINKRRDNNGKFYTGSNELFESLTTIEAIQNFLLLH